MSRRPRIPERLEAGPRKRLLAVYRQADELLGAFSCPASADCCHFRRTGKEPFVTRPEWLEVVRAVKARGGRLPGPPSDDEHTCPFLVDDRCSIYESRPLGCRTFFCHRVTGPGALPRQALGALVPAIKQIAEEEGADDGPRTLSSWLRLGGR